MPDEKKGITVKIDADLHAEVRQYLETHNITMAEFVALALDDELHPKMQIKEEKNMGNMRTIAVQVPEDLFQRLKEYLKQTKMSQRDFLIAIITEELDREQVQNESMKSEESQDDAQEDEPEPEEDDAPVEDESEEESEGMVMGM